MTECRRFVISGRVQGVWFRDSTRRVAEELNLTGHAINLANGSVEVIACGESAKLNQLQAWLAKGPELARVTSVEQQTMPVQHFSGFRIG